ncbi:MAG: hypothetical protein R6V14_01465, partial [Halanaerobiales bacterium]
SMPSSSLLSILFLYKIKIGKYLLILFLFVWTIIQFFSHWYYTIFGVSKEKLVSYNEFFKDTYRIIPASNEILIPDFYHVILHILILATIICLIIFAIQEKEKIVKNI